MFSSIFSRGLVSFFLSEKQAGVSQQLLNLKALSHFAVRLNYMAVSTTVDP